MDGWDFRDIGRAAQEEVRWPALFLIKQQGLSQAQTVEITSVQRQTVNICLKRYWAQGENSVLDERRVSSVWGKRLLTADEALRVRGWVHDETPDQLKFPFTLGTSRTVRDLIALRFGRTLGLSTVQLHLQCRGMMPQKSLAKDEFVEGTHAVLRIIHRFPEGIRTFFTSPPVHCAA